MKIERQLIKLLCENGRQSVSGLAKTLGVSRATVQINMERLEKTGVIQGYTVSINPHYIQQQVAAYVMISVVPNKAAGIVSQINKIPQLDMLCTISGQYDLLAKVTAETTEALDQCIDSIAQLAGVERTLSHVVLSHKVGPN